MKSLKFAVLAVGFSLGLVSSALRAEDAPPPPPPQEQGGKMEKPKGPRGDRLKMLSEALSLTDEQKAKIGPILADEAAAMKAVRDDAALADDAKKAKVKEIRDAHQAQVRALLTPEQQEKLDKMPKRGPGGPGGPRPEKKD